MELSFLSPHNNLAKSAILLMWHAWNLKPMKLSIETVLVLIFRWTGNDLGESSMIESLGLEYYECLVHDN